MTTEVVTCPRCNATYPEGEPHACVPQPADSGLRTGLWSFKLAIGITLWLVGAVAAWIWDALAQGGFNHSPAGTAASVVTIVCLGLGLLIVVRQCLVRFSK
jgi:hypothetical protein